MLKSIFYQLLLKEWTLFYLHLYFLYSLQIGWKLRMKVLGFRNFMATESIVLRSIWKYVVNDMSLAQSIAFPFCHFACIHCALQKNAISYFVDSINHAPKKMEYFVLLLIDFWPKFMYVAVVVVSDWFVYSLISFFFFSWLISDLIVTGKRLKHSSVRKQLSR